MFELLNKIIGVMVFFLNLKTKEYTQDKRDLNRIKFFVEGAIQKRKPKKKVKGRK